MADPRQIIGVLERALGRRAKQRAERLFDTVPNVENQYQEQALVRALSNPDALLTPFEPGRFQELAAKIRPHNGLQLPVLPEKFHSLRRAVSEPEFQGFDELPFLVMMKDMQNSNGLRTMGHEGRHRNVVLDKELQQPKTLIELLEQKQPGWDEIDRIMAGHETTTPRSFERSLLDTLAHFSRYDQVIPELSGDPRPAVNLRDYFDPFASGGQV